MDGSKGNSQTAWLYSQIIPFPFLPSHITESWSGFSEVTPFTEKYQKSSRCTRLNFVPLNKVTQAKNTKHPLTLLLPNKQDLIKQTMFCLICSSWIKNGDNHPNPDKTPTLPSENYILPSHCFSLFTALFAAKQKTMPDKIHFSLTLVRCCTATRSSVIRFWGILYDPSLRVQAQLLLLPGEPNRYGAVRREMGIFRGISARLLSHTEICPKVPAKNPS